MPVEGLGLKFRELLNGLKIMIGLVTLRLSIVDACTAPCQMCV